MGNGLFSKVSYVVSGDLRLVSLALFPVQERRTPLQMEISIINGNERYFLLLVRWGVGVQRALALFVVSQCLQIKIIIMPT